MLIISIKTILGIFVLSIFIIVGVVLVARNSQASPDTSDYVVDQKYVKKIPINIPGGLMGFAGYNLFFSNSAEKGGIMVYDISKNSQKLISLGSSGSSNIGKWAFAENYIAFYRQDSNAYQDQVVVFDLKTGKEKIIYTRNMADNFMPSSIAAWGNLVTWGEKCAIYLYDLERDSKKVVVDKSFHEGCKYGINHPAPDSVNDFIGFDWFQIYKDKITWVELTGKYGSGKQGVLYNLSTNYEATIPGLDARIWGDYLVYSKYRQTGKYDNNLYIYNIKTKAETTIPYYYSQFSGSPGNPHIFGNNVIFIANPVNDSTKDYLYIYNISNNILRRVTPNLSIQGLQQIHESYIWENKVVWMDNRSGKPELYLYEVHQDEVQLSPDSNKKTQDLSNLPTSTLVSPQPSEMPPIVTPTPLTGQNHNFFSDVFSYIKHLLNNLF